MKFFQLMTLSLAAVFLFTISAVAQPGQGRGRTMSPEQRKAQMERMATNLEMNDEQKASYFQLEEDFAKQLQTLRANSQGDRTAMREEMMKLRDEREESLRALLNEDQITKYEEMMANRQQMRGQRGQQQAQEAQEGKEKAKKEKKKKKEKKNKKKDKEKEGDS